MPERAGSGRDLREPAGDGRPAETRPRHYAARFRRRVVCGAQRGYFGADAAAALTTRSPLGAAVIILGLILLIIGFVLKIAIAWTIGIIILLVGLILALLGGLGHAVGGRRHYF
jgi:hypothetical protein